MFAFLRVLSRFYAVILVLLVLLVSLASITVVRIVDEDQSYKYIARILSDQKTVLHRSAYLMSKLHHTLHHSHHSDHDTQHLYETQNRLEGLRKRFQENDQALRDMTSKALEKFDMNKADWDMLLQSNLRFIELFSELRSNHEMFSLGNQDFTKLVQAFLYDYRMIQELLEKQSEEKLQDYLYILVLCFVGFIALLALEAFLIYIPFGRRMAQKFKAMDKERSALTQERGRLQAFERRLDLSIKSLDAGVFEWVIDQDQIFISQEALGLLLRKPDQLSTLHESAEAFEQAEGGYMLNKEQFFEFLHFEDRKYFEQACTQHFEKQHTLDVDVMVSEGLNTKESSAPFWINIKGRAQWDKETGDALTLNGVIQNITEIKAIENLNTIFVEGIEKSGLAVSIIRVHDNIRQFDYVSAGLCAMLKCETDDMVGSNLFMLNGPETSLDHIDLLDAIIDSGHPGELHLVHYRADGTAFMDYMQLTPIFDDVGHVIAYLSVHKDVSKQDKLDSESAKNKRRQAFASIAKVVLRRMVEILSGDDDQDQTVDIFQQMEKLSSLIYSVQALTVAEEQRSLKLFDVVLELRHIMHLYSNSMLGGKNVEIEVSEDEEARQNVLVDPEELNIVMLTILENAVEAIGEDTKDGKIEIYLQKQSLSVKDIYNLGLSLSCLDYVVITVKDNGHGILKTDLPYLFDPLYTKHKERMAQGMGLCVSNALVKSWGGVISVDSVAAVESDDAEAQGTTMYIYIPIQNEPISDMYHDVEEDLEISALLDALNEENKL